MFRSAFSVLASAAAFGAAALAAPAPVVDAAGSGAGLTVANDGEVTVTFGGRHGVYDKELYLVGPDGQDVFLFDGRTAEVGDTVSLGTFAAGTELVFRLAVDTTTGHQFDLFTGAGIRNPMAFENARAMSMGAGVAMVSFEDLWGGGDHSFNDFGFSLSNVLAQKAIATPVPAAGVLMLTALGGAAAWRRRAR